MDAVLTSLGLLAAMQPRHGREWAHDIELRYRLVLEALGDRLALEAVRSATLTHRWRPGVAELVEIAAHLEADAPLPEEALREVVYVVRRLGRAGAADYTDWSHPLIGDVVNAIGGYAPIAAEERVSSEIRRQFLAAYELAARRRLRTCAACLLSCPGERPAALFPSWEPFEPDAWERGHALPVPALLLPRNPTDATPRVASAVSNQEAR